MKYIKKQNITILIVVIIIISLITGFKLTKENQIKNDMVEIQKILENTENNRSVQEYKSEYLLGLLKKRYLIITKGDLKNYKLENVEINEEDDVLYLDYYLTEIGENKEEREEENNYMVVEVKNMDKPFRLRNNELYTLDNDEHLEKEGSIIGKIDL